MMNVKKHVDYWIQGADEERAVAADLFINGRERHGLFFLHLMMEKILKAHVTKKIEDIPPKSHNLGRLYELTGLSISQEDMNILGELSNFNLEGRYSDFYGNLPPAVDIKRLQFEAERIYIWLLRQF